MGARLLVFASTLIVVLIAIYTTTMSPTQQKALLLESKQGKYVVGTRHIPKPGPGQLLVKVKASGLNPVDWKIQKYGIIIEKFPAVNGCDAAGDVEALGEGVSGFSKGDRVFFQGLWESDRASFQQYAIADVTQIAKISTEISYDQAATIPAGLVAAYVGLYNISPKGLGFASPPLDASARGIHAGKPLLLLGGSSNVGQFTLQLAKASGFSPIITTASLKHADYLKSIGATHVIDRNLPLAAEVAKITTDPITHIYDTVSTKDTQQAAHDLLAPNGKLGILLPSQVAKPDERVLFVFGYPTPQNKDLLEALWKKLPTLLEEGTIKPTRVELLPGGLQGILEGLKKLENDQVSGVKLIARPQE